AYRKTNSDSHHSCAPDGRLTATRYAGLYACGAVGSATGSTGTTTIGPIPESAARTRQPRARPLRTTHPTCCCMRVKQPRLRERPLSPVDHRAVLARGRVM